MPRRIPAHIRKLMKELKQGLAEIYGDKLKAVYLYGSYARGDYRDGSDVDVMIVLRNYRSYGKEIDRTGKLTSNLSLEYGISISRTVTKEIQWKSSNTPCFKTFAWTEFLHERA